LGKKIFGINLAKLDLPNSEAHARLELPASPWELHDSMDKVRLQENEELYLEVDDYYAFEYLAPHLVELDASLNELNDLAGQLAVLDETAFAEPERWGSADWAAGAEIKESKMNCKNRAKNCGSCPDGRLI
jgi:hypothetical protein